MLPARDNEHAVRARGKGADGGDDTHWMRTRRSSGPRGVASTAGVMGVENDVLAAAVVVDVVNEVGECWADGTHPRPMRRRVNSAKYRLATR